MKTSLYTSILVALWSSACAAQTAPGASLPAGQAQATADTAAADSAAAADGSAVDSQVAEAAGTEVAPDTDLADTQPGDSSADTAKALPETHGLQVPPLPLPEFTQVVDSTGKSVTDQELLGHYTVLWFYPAASTGG